MTADPASVALREQLEALSIGGHAEHPDGHCRAFYWASDVNKIRQAALAVPSPSPEAPARVQAIRERLSKITPGP